MLAEIRQGMTNSLSYYGDMVATVGRDYGEAEIRTEGRVVDEELKAKDNAYLIPYADLFARHLDGYRNAGAADKAQWQKVEDGHRRYFDAALRHLTAWQTGEQVDAESGLPHLAHAICCLLFMAWLDDKEAVG